MGKAHLQIMEACCPRFLIQGAKQVGVAVCGQVQISRNLASMQKYKCTLDIPGPSMIARPGVQGWESVC